MVEVTCCLHEFPIVFLMGRVVQFTLEFPRVVRFVLKINTHTVGFMVTKQFADIHIPDLDTSYGMFDQTFVSKEEVGWERHFSTFTYD